MYAVKDVVDYHGQPYVVTSVVPARASGTGRDHIGLTPVYDYWAGDGWVNTFAVHPEDVTASSTPFPEPPGLGRVTGHTYPYLTGTAWSARTRTAICQACNDAHLNPDGSLKEDDNANG